MPHQHRAPPSPAASGPIAWQRRAPAPATAAAIDRVWTATAPVAGARHRVLPDGCVDLVVDDHGRALVVGPARTARLVELRGGGVVAGLRLRPGLARQVLRTPVGDLLDAVVPLDAVAPAVQRGLEHALAAGARVPDALERSVAGRVGEPGGVRRAAAIVAGLGTTADARPVAELAAALGLSERQLRRWCHDHCGHGPAELRRVLRLQTLLRLAAARPAASLAALALAAGFHDQQHMSREVRRLAGVTPARLLRRDGRSVQDRRAARA